MAQTQHIRLAGHTDAIPLSAAAHQRLLDYLADARLALAADPDADETIRDLEASLGEQLRAVVNTSGAPVNEAQMSDVLTSAGTVHPQGEAAPPPGGPARGPFWCRIDQGKWFGGLCLGIAAKTEFRVDWVRTIAILLAVGTAGVIGLVYLALLLVVPRVASIEEYGRLRDAPSPHPR